MGFGEVMVLSFVLLVFTSLFFLGWFTILDWLVQRVMSIYYLVRNTKWVKWFMV